ncbi:MAG: hypothetical protein K8T90_04215 [Planctomycetes bacterium]|nr:hypothetical protein [Planctomycetota bacterium]
MATSLPTRRVPIALVILAVAAASLTACGASRAPVAGVPHTAPTDAAGAGGTDSSAMEAPTLQARSTLLDVSNQVLLNSVRVTADERYIVASTTQGRLEAYSLDGVQRGSRRVASQLLAGGNRPDEMLVVTGSDIHLVGVPSLDTIQSVPIPPGSSPMLFAKRTRVGLGGWIAARRHSSEATPPHVSFIRGSPLEFLAQIPVPIRVLSAIESDPTADRVVICGDETRLAVVDATTGATTLRQLAEPSGLGLAVVCGSAWLSTRDASGAFWEVPLNGASLRVHPTGYAGQMQLVGDSDANLLAVVITEGEVAPLRVHCLLYAVEPNAVRQIGAASFSFKHGVSDIAILGRHRAIVLGGGRGTARIVQFE